MSQPNPDSETKTAEVPAENKVEVKLSPELMELEKRLNSTMLININKCIAEALKPIKDSIDKIVKSSILKDRQEIEIN